MKPKTENKNLVKNQKGQGLTEYIVIVALVFIGAIGVKDHNLYAQNAS